MRGKFLGYLHFWVTLTELRSLLDLAPAGRDGESRTLPKDFWYVYAEARIGFDWEACIYWDGLSDP